jgi:hypothetical protein
MKKRWAVFAILIATSGCSLMSDCTARSGATLRMPVEATWSEGVGSIHRVKGYYRVGFELSPRLAVLYDGPLEYLNSPVPTDYCVEVLTEKCGEQLARATRLGSGHWNFGLVDVIARYDGKPGSSDECSFGRLTILQIIHAGAITPP